MKKRNEDFVLEERMDCIEYKAGRPICGVAEFMQTTNVALGHLMEFKTAATDKLDRIEHLEDSLKEVATHAKSMDHTLQSMESTARELIGIATGKKQVPITIFYLVVFVLGAWMLLDKLSLSKGNLDLSPTGMKYSQPERHEQPK